MDEAARRERRAAAKRRVQRRRRAVAGGAVFALVAVVVVLSTGGGGGGGGPEKRATAVAAVRAVVAQVKHTPLRAKPKVVVRRTMPGAHLAPGEAVPILMYHVIDDPPPGTAYPALWVGPEEFTAQVEGLKAAGFHGVTLQQAWNAWHHKGKLPRSPIVLSFDDGYSGQVHNALPTLSSAGWPGVLNLELANLKDTGGTKAIRRLIRAGWEIDSHTLTHPDLTTVDDGRLAHELVGSRVRLRRYFGASVSRFFCYPSGHYDSRVIAAVKAAGYLAATTTQPGWAQPTADPFALPRIRIDRGMTAATVLQRINDTRGS
jgi:peptidoglycan/xylan/chitin deacetylase (PgdA/CDA1 family)